MSSEGTEKLQTEFYIAKGDASLGPWTILEIVERLARQEITVMDFVYIDSRQDWVPLMDCEAYKKHIAQTKPKAPPPKATHAAPAPVMFGESQRDQLAHEITETVPRVPKSRAGSTSEVQSGSGSGQNVSVSEPREEWFIQKGANRYGPMTYGELVRALQEKSVYDFDFVWQEGMETWTRIAEHEAFQPDKIREFASRLSQEKSNDPGIFFRRQHSRMRFDSEVIIHDDQSVWMGQSFEASAGGSGLVIENSTLRPGQVVRLHFAPTDGLPAFNALGEIVGKRFTRDVRGAKSPVRYAVRFLKLDGSAEPSVREYFESQERSRSAA